MRSGHRSRQSHAQIYYANGGKPVEERGPRVQEYVENQKRLQAEAKAKREETK
jgi:hypothetical protein